MLLCFTPVLESWACDLTACWEGEYLLNSEHLQEIFYNAHYTGLGWENYVVPSPYFPLLTVQQIEILATCIWGWVGLVGKDRSRGLISVVREKPKKTSTKRVRSFDFLHHIWAWPWVHPAHKCDYRLVTDGANCIIHYGSDWNEIVEGNFLSHTSRSDESIYYSLSVYLWMEIEFSDSNWWNVRNIKLIRADMKRNYWVELASDFTIPCTGLCFD